MGGSWRLCCGPYGLSCHAGVPQEPVELHEPRPQISAGSTSCQWSYQVAARPPAGQEVVALFIFIYLRCLLQMTGGWVFSISRGRCWNQKKKWILGGQKAQGNIFRPQYSFFRGLCWLCFQFLCVFIFLLTAEFYCDQTLQFLSIYLAAEWIIKSAFNASHRAHGSSECGLSTLLADQVLLR